VAANSTKVLVIVPTRSLRTPGTPGLEADVKSGKITPEELKPARTSPLLAVAPVPLFVASTCMSGKSPPDPAISTSWKVTVTWLVVLPSVQNTLPLL